MKGEKGELPELIREEEGKQISIDSANLKLIDIKLLGESTQETRSGKNLLKNTATTKTNNGINFTVNDDKTILVDGTNDGTANSSFIINIYSLEAGTYILNGCPSGGARNTYRLAIQETGSYSILGSIDIGNGSGEFTIDTTTNVQIAIFIQKGLTINNLLFKPMLRKATIADDTYEQYGASPSPDYPSEIENLEGKNKFSGWLKGKGLTTTTGEERNATTSATSDYIAVDFNKNKNYYLSGLTKTLQTFVAAYNSNKKFLGRTGAVLVSYFSLNSSSFTLGTAQGTGNIAYLRVTTYENSPAGTTGTIDDVDNLETQLETGTIATPYVPYNSLEFKVEGKNRFDCANSKIIYNNGNTLYERLTNGLKIISNGGQYNMIYFLVDTVKNLKDKTLTLSSDISFSKDSQLTTFGLFYTDTNGGNRTTLINNNNITSKGKYQVAGQVSEGENRYYVCIGLRPNIAYNYASGDYTIYDNLQIEYGETPTDYEPYKSQVAYFPLGEGQKLMKGSYLADDEIHHKRKQIVFDGSREYIRYTWLDSTNHNCFYTNLTDIYVDSTGTQTCLMSNYFKGDKFDNRALDIPNMWVNKFSSQIYFKVPNTITTVEELKAWLSNNPPTVEYELAEEEIVPYTETQQEQWNNIKNMVMYKGINNITCTATAKIKYYTNEEMNEIYAKIDLMQRVKDIEDSLSEIEILLGGV